MGRYEAVAKTRAMAKAYRGMRSCQEEADALGGTLAELDALHAEVLRLRARVEQLEPFLAVVPCPNPSEHGDADRRFEESLELIRERYGEAIELLGKGHDGEEA